MAPSFFQNLIGKAWRTSRDIQFFSGQISSSDLCLYRNLLAGTWIVPPRTEAKKKSTYGVIITGGYIGSPWYVKKTTPISETPIPMRLYDPTSGPRATTYPL